MKTLIITLLSAAVAMSAPARTMSEPMENAVAACVALSNAIGTGTTAQLKAANKTLKAADIVDFGDLWLEKGTEAVVDGHFIFDEEFVDSLIVNRKILDFSGRYAEKRSHRGSTGSKGRIKMTTRALKAGECSVWKTVNRKNAEYAIVAEPGALFTMTIRDDKGNVLYTETRNNKKGEPVRKARMTLPDKMTRVYIEVRNCGKTDGSFAILGN